MHTQITITGYLVGDIWMPAIECWKRLDYDLTREEARFTEPGTLRDHILAATNDSDFQSCSIAHGELTVTRTTVSLDNHTRRTKRVTRSWPLEHFPSIRDCLHNDPDWWPTFDDEE
jgi:hypothetical protein